MSKLKAWPLMIERLTHRASTKIVWDCEAYEGDDRDLPNLCGERTQHAARSPQRE